MGATRFQPPAMGYAMAMPKSLVTGPSVKVATKSEAAVAAVRTAITRLDRAVIELECFPEIAESLDMNDRELAAVISRYRAQLDEILPPDDAEPESDARPAA